MLWDAELVTKFELTVQKIVDFINEILAKVFGFVAEEEGWVEEETTVA